MPRLFPSRTLLHFLLAFALLASCRSPQVTSPDITINITADGESRAVSVPAGSTVSQAFQTLGITVPHEAHDGAYLRYSGDASVPGKGEILVWQPR